MSCSRNEMILKKYEYERRLEGRIEEDAAIVKPLLVCPYPVKELGRYTIMKQCGIVDLKGEDKYCDPRKIAECKIIYGGKNEKAH